MCVCVFNQKMCTDVQFVIIRISGKIGGLNVGAEERNLGEQRKICKQRDKAMTECGWQNNAAKAGYGDELNGVLKGA